MEAKQTDDPVKLVKGNSPTIRNKFDALAILLHAIVKSKGFLYYGSGDSNDDSANSSFVASNWNQSSDSYTFRYKRTKLGSTLVLKSLMLGDKLLVHGFTEGENQIYTAEFNANDFVNDSIDLKDFDKLYKNVNRASEHLLNNILGKIYTTLTTSETSSVLRVQNDPLRETGPRYPQPHIPQPFPDWDMPPRPLVGGPPFGIGSNDLDPIPNPFYPEGRGTEIGPNHPGFGNIRDPYANPPLFGPQGGRGRGQPGLRPPNARFDPYGPPGFNNPEPDNDDFPPGNMYL